MSKTPIVCPKCGALYQVAAQRGREYSEARRNLFRRRRRMTRKPSRPLSKRWMRGKIKSPRLPWTISTLKRSQTTDFCLGRKRR